MKKIMKDIAATDASILLTNAKTEESISNELLIDANRLDREFITANIRPEEVNEARKKVESLEASIQLTDAQKMDQLYVTANIRPATPNAPRAAKLVCST